jgi:acyl-coenzyme A thioesterase PaaI-like protein
VDETRPAHGWIPDQPIPPGQRAALVRLASALRETIRLSIDTDASEEELIAAAAHLEEWNDALSGRPRGRPLRGWAEAANAGSPRAFYDSSPVSGPANPIAAPVEMRATAEGVIATCTLGIPYEGPPGHVHGGITALIFDEVLGMVQSQTGQGGMTGRLTVHYRRPTPLNRELTFRGWLDRVEGRKIFTLGTLHAGEELCAEAEGLFISVPREKFSQLAGMEGWRGPRTD